MSLWRKLFGGGASSPAPEPIDYNGFQITPSPISEDGGFRISATITAVVEGQEKTHHLIRADVIRDRDEAVEASIGKARQMIDQMGIALFGE